MTSLYKLLLTKRLKDDNDKAEPKMRWKLYDSVRKGDDCRKRSDPRDAYHTTNSNGHILTIANPQRQFKSTMRRSYRSRLPLRAAFEPKSLLSQEEGDEVHYISLKTKRIHLQQLRATGFFDVITSLISGIDSPDSYRHQFLRNEHYYHPLYKHILSTVAFHTDDIQPLTTYHQPSKRSLLRFGLRELTNNMNLSPFHAHQLHEWSTVHRLLTTLLNHTQTWQILTMTRRDYIRSGGSKKEFKTVDDRMSYMILSLCHFQIFVHELQRVKFWAMLAKCKERTKFILTFVDAVVEKSINGCKSSTIGRRELLRRHLSCHSESWMERIESVPGLVLTRHAIDDMWQQNGSWVTRVYESVKQRYFENTVCQIRLRMKQDYREMRYTKSHVEKRQERWLFLNPRNWSKNYDTNKCFPSFKNQRYPKWNDAKELAQSVLQRQLILPDDYVSTIFDV